MYQENVPLIERAEIPFNECIYGPLLVCEEASTTWIAPGWELRVDEWSNLLLFKR